MKFQNRVMRWMHTCFGEKISLDQVERNQRFTEEALELVQSCGMPKKDAHDLVEYVYGRPVGEKAQEVGGVMVTLAGLCTANRLDMMDCGHIEVDNCWTKVEKIREKQKNKPKFSARPE